MRQLRGRLERPARTGASASKSTHDRRACVVGLGQDAAGDDGVGLAVLDHLVKLGVPASVELLRATDPSVLIELLGVGRPVIVVDAVLGDEPGTVLELSPEDLARGAHLPLSTHGLGVCQAIDLAGALGEMPLGPVRVVGVSIGRPALHQRGLSEAVAAAVPRAAARVLALLESSEDPAGRRIGGGA